MSTLGQNIKTARLKAHMTQAMLGDAVNLASGTISHYENGWSTPTHETVELIATVLGVSVEELYKGDAPVRTGRVRTVGTVEDLTEEEEKLLEKILVIIRQYVRSRLSQEN